jgi:hypothetical protein
MKIESMQAGQASYISPLRGEPIFGGAKGTGVDASGALISSKETLPAPLNEWKRYVLGLGNSAASNLSDFRLVLESNIKSDVHVLIGNIQILKPNGEVIAVWNGGSAPPSPAGLTCRSIELKPSSP